MSDIKNLEIYLEEYEKINKELENDDLILDEKIKLYERSSELSHKLTKIIEEAELKVEGINKKYEEF